MSDVSPARRLLGRLLLAGGAVVLPLTASISYAQGEQAVQPVELPPSSAAPGEGEQDDRQVDRQVRVVKLQRDGAEDTGEERRVFAMRHDGEPTEEQRKKFEDMAREWEKNGAEWEKRVAEMEKMAPRWEALARDREAMALALADKMPQVIENCDEKGAGTRSSTDGNGRRRIVICQRQIEMQSQRGALMSLRGARGAIAGNREMSEDVRR